MRRASGMFLIPRDARCLRIGNMYIFFDNDLHTPYGLLDLVARHLRA